MIQILEKRTEKDPLSHIGETAGICWNSDCSDIEKNINRGKDCIKSGHMRVSEYPSVELVISEVSARTIRELYTHIIGVSRLQESTRYVNCEEFGFYVPPSAININEKQSEEYNKIMNDIKCSYVNLLDLGMSKEDVANVLPLGMHTKIVWKTNLRALIHFMEMRLCSRAYKEIRSLANEIKTKLSEYSDEWKWICDNYFVPNCVNRGYCIETKCCGKAPKGLDGLKEKIIRDFFNYTQSLENGNYDISEMISNYLHK